MEIREIYITGFGKFTGHEDVNASWEAVQLLPDTVKIDSQVFKVNKLEVPIVYEKVDQFVEKIWKTNPILVSLFLLAMNGVKWEDSKVTTI